MGLSFLGVSALRRMNGLVATVSLELWQVFNAELRIAPKMDAKNVEPITPDETEQALLRQFRKLSAHQRELLAGLVEQLALGGEFWEKTEPENLKKLLIFLTATVSQAIASALRAGTARGTRTWTLLIHIHSGFGMPEVPGRGWVLVGPQSKPLSLRLLFSLFI